MRMSDLIEEFIKDLFDDQNEQIEIQRNELAEQFNCVPSQINYVISTRFIPELGFYVESRRGGNGYIKISKVNIYEEPSMSDIFDKIGNKMSQSVVDVYLKDFLMYNIVDKKEAKIIRAAVSDKSLNQVDFEKKDMVRADIFKNLIINLL